MLHLRARPWAPAMHHQQQRCPAASASPCTSGRRVPPLDQRLSLFASRRRAHSPPSATETTGPVSVQDAAERVAALKEQREKALKQLREVDAALRDEMFRERANGANASSNGGGHGDKAAHAVASTGWGVSELDNFGYIRQFSGEPYDLTKVMGVPGGLLEMGIENFIREGRAILETIGFKNLPRLRRSDAGAPAPVLTPEMLERQKILQSLTLSNKAIWDREHARPQVRSPWLIKGPYYVLCWVLDVIFDNRPIPRFWLLETVARMPYFSYINMLHLYESLGWWRRSMEARKVHFAEEWNEAHHLLIMESLGGDQRWADRFVAQHAAVVYYFALLLMWVASPTLAYNFSELIEAHAVDTYSQFLDENEEALRKLPPPRVAKLYYEADDMYLFNEFQTERDPGTRFVAPKTLYDVFVNIRDDEGEHVATMHAMQRQDVLVRAPNIEAMAAGLVALAVALNLWLPRFVAVAEVEEGEAVEGLTWVLETFTAALSDALALMIGL